MTQRTTHPALTLGERLDQWQRHHAVPAFCFAVIKKYVDDEAGYRASLLAYYGFLSIFPLLLVLTTLLDILLQHDQELSNQLIRGVVDYLPAVGRDLQHSVHGLGTTGLTLAAGLALALFGARGMADVLRSSLDHIWHVPIARRSKFPASLGRSFLIIVVGGLGLVLTPAVLGYTLTFVPNRLVTVLSTVITMIVMFWVLVCIIKVGTSHKRPLRSIWVGSLAAVVTLALLQSIGGVIMAHELHRLDSLYGTFALVLGLIFWLYLQTQVLLFAFELDSVRYLKLWPRSVQPPLTDADHTAHRLSSIRAQLHDDTP